MSSASGEVLRPVVIGLAGGIGAGKSRVASVFRSLGLLIADSDRAARDALERDDVKSRLTEWWGEGILDADGRVDRARIAQIVFENEDERERLEGLIHPIVREGRGELLARAEAEGAPGIVVDAPLLFEAGLDAECDAVVFVDASYPLRLARVRRTRGWDERELDRRAAAQWSLDQKRAACGFVVDNGADGRDPDDEALRDGVERVLRRIQADLGGAENV